MRKVNESINLSDYLELQESIETKIIITCCVRLDKRTILEILLHENVLINGKYYKVPETKLLNCLYKRRFGETKLDFEEIL